jgi:hypothetical protein
MEDGKEADRVPHETRNRNCAKLARIFRAGHGVAKRVKRIAGCDRLSRRRTDRADIVHSVWTLA